MRWKMSVMIAEKEQPLVLDYERMTATVPLTSDSAVVIISKGKARLVSLPAHGELVVKTHQGDINQFYCMESHKF